MSTELTKGTHKTSLALSLAAVLIAGSLPAVSQPSTRHGVTVEEVSDKLAASAANVKEGDIFESWLCKTIKSDIETPFDFAEAEIQKGACREVTFEGFRGNESHTWVLGQGDWGIGVRPVLSEKAVTVYKEGRELFKAGKMDAAIQRWQEVALLEQRVSNRWLVAWLHFNAAQSAGKADNWQVADAAYARAVQSSASIKPSILAQVLYSWADTFWHRSQWKNAEIYYRRSLSEVEKEGNSAMPRARCLTALGSVASDSGDLAKGDEYFNRALTIYESVAPDSINVATNLSNLGSIALRRGDLVKAEQYCRRDLAITEKAAPESVDLAISLNNCGGVMTQRGDLLRAEQYFRKALAITERLAPESFGVAVCLGNIGSVIKGGGDLPGAEKYFLKALTIKEKLVPGSLSVGRTFISLGDIAYSKGDLTGAEEHFRRALAIEEHLGPASLDLSESMERLGNVALDRGDVNGAEERYRKALAIREIVAPNSIKHAETLVALARVMLRKHQPDSAGQLYRDALNALEHQSTQLGGSDEVRSNFRSKHAGYYREYVELLLTQNQPELAFTVLERSRAQTLLEMMQEAHIDIRKGLDTALLDKEASLLKVLASDSGKRVQLLNGEHTEEQISSVNRKIQSLLSEYQEIQGQIRTGSPRYAAFTRPNILEARHVEKDLLDSNTVLLEFALGEAVSHVWSVTSTSIRTYELPKRSEVERLARQVYGLLTVQSHGDQQNTALQEEARLAHANAEYPKAAATLSDMILGPVARDIRGQGKRLLIVADGALQYIPFAALPEPEHRGSDRSKWEPLIVSHEIVNLPSASLLEELRREKAGRKRAARAVAVLADPVFDSEDIRVKQKAILPSANREVRGIEGSGRVDMASLYEERLTRSVRDVRLASRGGYYLPRLQYSRQEAQAIVNAAPERSIMLALDFRANRSTATSQKLALYRTIHFATHGLLDNDHPELSGLVLSMVDERGRPQNGFLELQDIYNLNLPVDLVVLSACETGLGKEISGEGLVGLTRGFMYAGALRVVASLWKIDDEATANLMGRFYRAMERHGMRPAAALRRAQIEMWNQKQWKDPYFWAAFQIQGDWQ